MIKAPVAAAIVGTLALAAPSLADNVPVGAHLRFSAGPGANNGIPLGGELIVNVLQTGEFFRTFCLELEEHILFGSASGESHPFQVDAVTDSAVLGGNDLDSPGDSSDQISSRTAFLYQNFARGTLAGYTYGIDSDPDRIRSADALQNAIWFLEHEISDPHANIIDPATQALIDQFLTMDMGGFTGLGDVMVLNLVYRAQGPDGQQIGDLAQDVLVLVPLPHAAGLGLVGLLGVMGVTARRRR